MIHDTKLCRQSNETQIQSNHGFALMATAAVQNSSLSMDFFARVFFQFEKRSIVLRKTQFCFSGETQTSHFHQLVNDTTDLLWPDAAALLSSSMS